jgi:hypothetical protein
VPDATTARSAFQGTDAVFDLLALVLRRLRFMRAIASCVDCSRSCDPEKGSIDVNPIDHQHCSAQTSACDRSEAVRSGFVSALSAYAAT